MTPIEIEEHNRLFREAVNIADPQLKIHGRAASSSNDLHITKEGLPRSLALLTRVLQLNPKNWSAMWFMGKIHQSLGHELDALMWFTRAHNLNSSQVDIAREASLCAMSLGRCEEAIFYARVAVDTCPLNVGLQTNLALALFLAGKSIEAKELIDETTMRLGSDAISRTLSRIVGHFIANGERPPTTPAELEVYWKGEKGGNKGE